MGSVAHPTETSQRVRYAMYVFGSTVTHSGQGRQHRASRGALLLQPVGHACLHRAGFRCGDGCGSPQVLPEEETWFFA